jgi:hypothetical protein
MEMTGKNMERIWEPMVRGWETWGNMIKYFKQ